jgi:hypothetical protein
MLLFNAAQRIASLFEATSDVLWSLGPVKIDLLALRHWRHQRARLGEGSPAPGSRYEVKFTPQPVRLERAHYSRNRLQRHPK